MSNDQISVPRQLLERVTEFTGGFHPMEPARSQLRALLAQPNTCTCPSGDGSLRWPCPVCPPEPVGWQFLQDGKWWNGDDRIKDHRLNTEAAGYPTRNVFASHPPAQAPVVLPERKTYTADGLYCKYTNGWNACLDEFKRLNPGITEAAPLRKS